MGLEVIAAVLLGALLHALWNTLAKHNAGGAGDVVVVGLLAGIPAALCLPWTGLPARDSWLQLIASALIHVAYFKVLVGAYRGGALSVAYPLMSTSPTIISAMVSTPNTPTKASRSARRLQRVSRVSSMGCAIFEKFKTS